MIDLEIVSLNSEPRISTQNLAEQLGTEHQNVIELIGKYVPDFEQFGSVTFKTGMTRFTRQDGTNGASGSRYALLNENQCYLLLTYARNSDRSRALKVALIQKFAELRAANTPRQLSRLELLEIAMHAERERLTAETKLEAERALNLENAPKVEAFEDIVSSTGLMSVAQVAKLLGTGEIRLFALLRARGVLMDRTTSGAINHNLPYQQHLEAGRFEIKARSQTLPGGRELLTSTTYVTGKGVEYIRQLVRGPAATRQHHALETPGTEVPGNTGNGSVTA